MLLTEEEAKAKWCPFVRYSNSTEDNNSANRWGTDQGDDENPESCRCIASACMSWRWEPRDELTIPEGAPIPDQYQPYATIRATCRGVETVWKSCRLRLRDADGKELLPMRGYCGRAGKAE